MSNILRKAVRNTPLLRTYTHKLSALRTDKGILQIEKGNLEARIRELNETLQNPRNFLADHFLKGSGIEIGAAQLPVKIPVNSSVKYVDVFSAEDLRRVWPKDYTKLDIVEVDVIDDGEKLDKFRNGSLDFIIANHFLEHCLDPIGTLINMHLKLRKNGVLYMAIPDKRFTFDKPRMITSYEHLLDEHSDKTKEKYRESHTEDFVRLGESYKGNVKKRTKELLESGYRVHYHVWTSVEMIELFSRVRTDFDLSFEIQGLLKNQHEVICILKKMR